MTLSHQFERIFLSTLCMLHITHASSTTSILSEDLAWVVAVGGQSNEAQISAALFAAGVEHVEDLRYLDGEILLDVGLDPDLSDLVMKKISSSSPSSSAAWHSKKLLCRISPEFCGVVPIGYPQSATVCSEVVPSDAAAKNAVESFNQGQRKSALGYWSQSIKHYQRALRLRPGYSAALAQLGLAMMHTGRLKESVESFKLALATGSLGTSSSLHTEHNLQLALARLKAKNFVAAQKIIKVWSRQVLLQNSLRRARELASRSLSNNLGSGALFLEFGVFRGDSLRIIVDELLGFHKVHAFDSFEGLPEEWKIASRHPLASAPIGTFRVGQKDHQFLEQLIFGGPMDAVEMHVGLFNETLPEFIGTLAMNERQPFLAFAHLDCDLYSSTSYVLDALAQLCVSGTVLQFDELIGWPGWEKDGEFRALDESGLEYRWLETSGQAVSVEII